MKLLSGDMASALGSSRSSMRCSVDSSRSPLEWRTRSKSCYKRSVYIVLVEHKRHTRFWDMRRQIQSFPSATYRMLTLLTSSAAGSISIRSSKRLPRDSSSMRTKAWLSFFHRIRLLPEREKQNERYFGKVEPELPWDATDLARREAF
jgi:hypothetical protein